MHLPVPAFQWLPIFFGVVANMSIGSLWYSRRMFGQEWARLVRLTPEAMKENAGKAMTFAVVAAVVFVLLLDYLLQIAGVTDVPSGMLLAFVVWGGFFAVHNFMRRAFDGGPKKLFWIVTFHDLTNFLVVAALLSLWR